MGREDYFYFPNPVDLPVGTALLDANITSHLDSIAEKGTAFDNPLVRKKLNGFIDVVGPQTRVLPGVSAAEAVIRRGGNKETHNYFRRVRNVLALVEDDFAGLRTWIEGDEIDIEHRNASGPSEEVFLSNAQVFLESQIRPSYVIMLKIYQLSQMDQSPQSKFRQLSSFAGELYARSSAEIKLGALLLAGNGDGADLASSIMKIKDKTDPVAIFNSLWNASFDLTYSRLAQMTDLPGWRDNFQKPVVFVTDDTRLGKFLEIVSPGGAYGMPRGGSVTASTVDFNGYMSDDAVRMIDRIVREDNSAIWSEQTAVEDVARIRTYRSKVYIKELEEWVTHFLCG